MSDAQNAREVCILAVDDREDNLLIVRAIFDEHLPEYRLITALGADVAREILNSEPIDGIICDVQMPGIDGIEFCRILRKNPQTALIPIVLVTAHSADTTVRIQGLEAGADDFLTKPIDNLELVARIKVMVRIRRAEELRQSEERYRRLYEEKNQLAIAIEQAGECVMITDAAGVIRYVNPAFERISGFSRQEAIGKSPSLVKSGEHDGEFFRQFWLTIASGKVWKGHFINRRKNGEIYEVEATVSPVRDEQGTIIQYVAVKRDVTHEVRMEKQLRQAQKMEAIGVLAGGIAHDFNNILGAILGYADITRMSLPEGGDEYQNLQKIILASRRAQDLIKQILAFSRQGDSTKTPLNWHLVIQETVQLLRASLPKTIEIRLDIDKKSGTVLADATQLHQIVMNLCTNAFHAMREAGGQLCITLRGVTIDAAFVRDHPRLRSGNWVRLTIRDSGVGIEPHVLEHVFDPYFTTKPVGEGTGLGLSVVLGIVTQLDGVVEIQSQPGKGTEVEVWLPRQEGIAVVEKSVQKDIPRGSMERVLVVDDEPDIVAWACKALSRLGYEAEGNTDSMAALETLKRDPSRWQVIIIDQVMPGMPGPKLIEEIRKLRADLPIVAWSGNQDLIPAGPGKMVDLLLAKPVNVQELASGIRNVLHIQQTTNRGEKA